MTKDEKEIDNLLKNSFTLTDEEIEKLKAIMANPENNFIEVEDDFAVET